MDVRRYHATVPFKGQTDEDTSIVGSMKHRVTLHGRSRTGGAPPGLYRSRINTRTREAHISSSEVEPTITEKSARISSWLHFDNVGTLADSRPGPYTQCYIRSSGNSDLQRPASASKGTALWGRRGQIECQKKLEISPTWDFYTLCVRNLEEKTCARHIRTKRHKYKKLEIRPA
jgi:hypothetical protein